MVPAGEFITGAIRLKSNVNLHISSGATVRFTRDTRKYPLVFTRWEGIELMNYSPFIYAFEAENIAITGDGNHRRKCRLRTLVAVEGPDQVRMERRRAESSSRSSRAL